MLFDRRPDLAQGRFDWGALGRRRKCPSTSPQLSFTVDRWALIANSNANPWSLRGPCLAPKTAVPVSWDWRDDAAWLRGKEFRKQPSSLWSLLSLLVSSWRVSVAFLGTKTCFGGLDMGVHAITSAFFFPSVLLEKRGWEFQMAV